MVKIFNDSISSIERSHWAIYLEKWQSGRMRWTRNQDEFIAQTRMNTHFPEFLHS